MSGVPGSCPSLVTDIGPWHLKGRLAPTNEKGADTEGELIDKVAAHAARDYGLPEVTPEVAANDRAAIRHE